MILAGLQIAAVTVTGVPEFCLDDAEGEKLAKLMSNAARHYPVVGMGISDKAKDTFFLIAGVGQIAFAHARAYAMRKAMEKAKDVTPAPAPSATAEPGFPGFDAQH
jgi:hypothetical protein